MTTSPLQQVNWFASKHRGGGEIAWDFIKSKAEQSQIKVMTSVIGNNNKTMSMMPGDPGGPRPSLVPAEFPASYPTEFKVGEIRKQAFILPSPAYRRLEQLSRERIIG